MHAEPEWVSAHLFHQGDLDALVLDVIEPLDLPGPWFFLRHWDGGLHVRLRVRCDSPAAAASMRALVTERCGRYLAAHPSEHQLTDEEYARSAAKFALLEGATDHRRTRGAPDGVEFVPYQRSHAGYDVGAAGDELEWHFTDSSRLAIDVLRRRHVAGHRETAAFAQLLLAWFTAEPSLHRLVPLIAGDASPADPPHGSPRLWQAAVDRRYQAQREQLSGIAVRMHALVFADDAPPGGLFTDWLDSLRHLRTALLDAGTPESGVLPVLNRCAHLACNRAGVSLTEEGYLRVLAARTVQTLTGTRR